MKRMILAAILALCMHGLLLGTEFNWIKKKSSDGPKTSVIKMTLVCRQPDKLKMKSVSKKPSPVIKKKKAKQVSKPVVTKPHTARKIKHPNQTPAKPASKPEPPSIPKEPELVYSDPDENLLSADIQIAPINNGISSSTSIVKEARPLYRENPPPQYPGIARKRGYQGIVLLDVLVNQNGIVDDIRVSKPSGYTILDKRALVSVKDWLFEPGTRGGKVVKMWVRVPIRFQLK